MRTIIAGSRTITNPLALLDAIEKCGWDITEVVCGGARGADELGKKWAEEHSIPVKMFPADWESGYGGMSGHIRNREMAMYAEALIALWDGHSNGTRNMIYLAKWCKLKVYVKEVY